MGIVNQRKRLRTRDTLAAAPIIKGKARPQYVPDAMDVYQAALERIRWIFKEFDGNVVVSNSGGKDSTVTLELAFQVATELNMLPLRVQWLDQECEFQSTVEYQRYIQAREGIQFDWYQVPFLLFNATNHEDPWLHVWDPALAPDGWVREKEENSIKENTWGTTRFKETLSAINAERPGQAVLIGMRSEESPARRVMMTSKPMYKWVTWSSVDGFGGETCFHFYPIYDWSYRDVWKAIWDNQWRYNTHYDVQFRYGIPVRNMRVSNYHHETALGALLYLQEAEPETWEAATRRLSGINSYSHLGKNQMPASLPYMFSSWTEYMHHLIDNLVPDEEGRDIFRHWHKRLFMALPEIPEDVAARVIGGAVIGNDRYGTTIDMFMVSHRNPDQREEWRREAEKKVVK